MRPQDIVILLKIVVKDQVNWQLKDLAHELNISQSEISDSLNRSALAGLLDAEKKKSVHRNSLMEFLQYGLHYVFPATPGSMVNGVYTAHSHPFMQQFFKSEMMYVWPHSKSTVRGLAIEPLYKGQADACLIDEQLYLTLALIDVIRVGRVREMDVAVKELRKLIL